MFKETNVTATVQLTDEPELEIIPPPLAESAEYIVCLTTTNEVVWIERDGFKFIRIARRIKVPPPTREQLEERERGSRCMRALGQNLRLSQEREALELINEWNNK